MIPTIKAKSFTNLLHKLPFKTGKYKEQANGIYPIHKKTQTTPKTEKKKKRQQSRNFNTSAWTTDAYDVKATNYVNFQ